ncbi:unnamed protein product [Cuscuta europaea]|uniref:Uncharacterized protein n=1 Tax=Cuscuta europaea TaxID=41803 RepID=A0A9P0Z5X0_CUSEU|nr:unnamed protein product [Cuscuta europaea]
MKGNQRKAIEVLTQVYGRMEMNEHDEVKDNPRDYDRLDSKVDVERLLVRPPPEPPPEKERTARVWRLLLISTFACFVCYFIIQDVRNNSCFVDIKRRSFGYFFIIQVRFVRGSDKACTVAKSFETLTWSANSLALFMVVYSVSSQRVGETFDYAEPHRKVWRFLIVGLLLSLITTEYNIISFLYTPSISETSSTFDFTHTKKINLTLLWSALFGTV